jgi:hypothetical protein
MHTSLRKSLVVSALALGATFIVPRAIAAPDLLRVGAGRWIANGTVLR